MLWPKVYVKKADEDEIAVYTEHTIAWDRGVSDEQAGPACLSTSIGSSLGVLPRDDQAVSVPEPPSAPIDMSDPARPSI